MRPTVILIILLIPVLFIGSLFLIPVLMIGVGPDYKLPSKNQSIVPSDVMFILPYDPGYYYIVSDSLGMDENPGMRVSYSGSVLSPVSGNVQAIYIPVPVPCGEGGDGFVWEGPCFVNVLDHVQVQSSSYTAYLKGISPIIESGFIQSGSVLGTSSGVVQISVENNKEGGWYSYYTSYLYWQTRDNLFPILNDPVRNPYTYTSFFGYRTHPVTGQPNSFHNGVDLAVKEMTQLIAVEDGIIESIGVASDRDPGGNRITLRSADGLRKYQYMHLALFLVEEGTEVVKGQNIALSGNSGRSTGPHLHFTFIDVKNNRHIDPLPALLHWEKGMDWDAYVNYEED